MRLLWLTDIHLNFLKAPEVQEFLARAAALSPDVVLLGGDIGEAPDLEQHLQTISEVMRRPIYFVLGNHDCYRSSIRAVRAAVRGLSMSDKRLRWLPAVGTVELTKTTGLLGHDGWADARAGDFNGSTVFLNDYVLIEELLVPDKETRRRRLQALGDEAADFFRAQLPAALDRFRHLVVLTHVPPFREACWHAGKISDDDWLPHFTCVAVGQVLREAMRRRPDRKMTVLCGHTHGRGEAEILPNLTVKTGGAEYGAPELQEMLSVA